MGGFNRAAGGDRARASVLLGWLLPRGARVIRVLVTQAEELDRQPRLVQMVTLALPMTGVLLESLRAV